MRPGRAGKHRTNGGHFLGGEGRGVRRPRLGLVDIMLSLVLPSACTQVSWVPVLALSCDLSFFIGTVSFMLESSSPQGGRRPPGGWRMAFVQEAGLPTSEDKPGPSQCSHWGSEPTTHL